MSIASERLVETVAKVRQQRDTQALADPDTWTPDRVQARIVEAVQITIRTTRRPGPKQTGNCYPETVVEFADLATLSFAETLERWMDQTEARAAKLASAAEIKCASEAEAWLAYVADDPLRADAVRTWAVCTALGRSIEETLQRRRDYADSLIERIEAQHRVRDARHAGKRNPLAASNPFERIHGDMRRIAAEKAAWGNARIAERREKLYEVLAKLPKSPRTEAAKERVERQREAAIRKAEAYCKRIRRSASILTRREAVVTGAVRAKPHALKLTRQDVLPGLNFHKSRFWEKLADATDAIADALNRQGVAVR